MDDMDSILIMILIQNLLKNLLDNIPVDSYSDYSDKDNLEYNSTNINSSSSPLEL